MNKILIACLLCAWLVFVSAINRRQDLKTPPKAPPKMPVAVPVTFVEDTSQLKVPEPQKKPLKSTKENAGGGKVGERIDAHYTDARKVITWLMQHNARLLIVDQHGAPLAELDQRLSLTKNAQMFSNGVWRTVDKEIRAMNGGQLPAQGVHALLYWPNSLFWHIRKLAQDYQATHLVLQYSIQGQRLRIKPIKVFTKDGRWLMNLPPILLT